MVTVLVGAGLTCLGVGLYEYFTSDVQKYPANVRQALRKGLYYQNKHDHKLALKYLREALDLALASPELERNGAPLTGIMIQVGALLETMGRLPEARQALVQAFEHVTSSQGDLPSAEDMAALPEITQKKATGIAQKLGDVCVGLKRDEEAERWYTWSVEHLLRVSSKPTSPYGDDDKMLFNKEHMPAWLTETELGASLEALATFYASRHRPTYAIPLYMRALTLADVHKTCHATVLMNNLAEAFTSVNRFEDAKQWAQKGIDLAQNPNTRKQNKDGEICDETCGILLFNMGMILEVSRIPVGRAGQSDICIYFI